MGQNDIAKKIRDLRASNNLTLEEVAQRVGVGKSTVRKWEVGQIENMRRDKIAKLAAALNTTPGYLMGWEDKSDKYSDVFRQSLSEALASIDSDSFSGVDEALCDYRGLSDLIESSHPLSLSEACIAADKIGETVGHLLQEEEQNNAPASQEGDGRVREFVELFSKLTSEQQAMLIAQMKGLLANQ